MQDEQFWEIIEQSRRTAEAGSGKFLELQYAALIDALSTLPDEDIFDFEKRLNTHFSKAYRWDLWGAAFVMEGGCSDDGFMDFRNWLIAQGRKVYEAALADPDSLADLTDVKNPFFERLTYTASHAYETKHDEGMLQDAVPDPMPPAQEFEAMNEPAGEPFEEDADYLKQRFPRLFEAYKKNW